MNFQSVMIKSLIQSERFDRPNNIIIQKIDIHINLLD